MKDEQKLRERALWLAMSRMHEEHPPKPVELEYGLRVDHFVMMDQAYLKRLAEIAEEEYQKLLHEN